MRFILSLILMLTCVTRAPAATLTETSILCDQKLEAYFDSSGNPVLTVECTTYDSAGVVLRQRRPINVYARLTGPQQTGLVSILQQVQQYAASELVVPTPTPTKTPTPTRTPTPSSTP